MEEHRKMEKWKIGEGKRTEIKKEIVREIRLGRTERIKERRRNGKVKSGTRKNSEKKRNEIKTTHSIFTHK